MMLQCSMKYPNVIIVMAAVCLTIGRGGVSGADQKTKPESLSEPEKRVVVADDSSAERRLQPPDNQDITKPSECTNYNYLGASLNDEYYSCCGGLRKATIKKEDDHPNLDCNPSKYVTVQSKTFDCNGLKGQASAKKRCSERWGWIDEPKYCWKWSECFAGACIAEVLELGSSTKDEAAAFCGDGRCDTNRETSSNCPIDCCQAENPICVAVNNTCTDACCGEDHCCNGLTSATLQLFAEKFWKAVLGILAVLAVLINVICCCCCYCCYSKWCKGSRRYNQGGDIEMPSKSQRRT